MADIISILDNKFIVIDELIAPEFYEDKLEESLDTGFLTNTFKVDKSIVDADNLQLSTNIVRKDREGNKRLLSLNAILKDVPEYKELRYEDYPIQFLQDQAPEIPEPKEAKDISYYLNISLMGTPIKLGTVEPTEIYKLDYNQNTKRATRLMDIFADFNCEPEYQVIFEEDSNYPLSFLLNVRYKRGRDTGIVLDSEADLFTAEHSSNASEIASMVIVLPYEETVKDEESKVVTVQSTEAVLKSGGSKTEKQLAYLKRQKGGTYTQGSARNNWSPEPAPADCSSIVYKSLIAAGIPCGYKKGDWLGTTYTLRDQSSRGQYFTIVKNVNDIQPGDIVLCNSWGHVVTYMGDNQYFHASQWGVPHGYGNWSYYKSNHNRIIRPKDRGTATVGAPTPEQNNVLGNSNKDQTYRWLRQVGFNHVPAVAIMGNISRETGNTFDPKIKQHGGGPGRGLIQWSVGDRWQTIVNFYNSNGLDPMTIEGQIKGVKHELTKTWESDNMVAKAPNYGATKQSNGFDTFNTFTNVSQATTAFCRIYERAGIEAMGERQAAAQSFDKHYKGTYEKGSAASSKTQTVTSKNETVIKTGIQDIEYDDGDIFTLKGSNNIISRRTSEKFDYQDITMTNYKTIYHQANTNDQQKEFEAALALLKSKKDPIEEYKVVVSGGLKDFYIGDALTIVSHNFYSNDPLILEARLNHIVTTDNFEEITLSNFKRITPEIPIDIRRTEDALERMRKSMLTQEQVGISSRNGYVLYKDMDQIILDAVITKGDQDVTYSVDSNDLAWTFFDSNNQLVLDGENSNIIDSINPVSNGPRQHIYDVPVDPGSGYRIHNNNLDIEYMYRMVNTNGLVVIESEYFEPYQDINFRVSSDVVKLIVIVNGESFKHGDLEVWAPAKPLKIVGRSIVLSHRSVLGKITAKLTYKGRSSQATVTSSDGSSDDDELKRLAELEKKFEVLNKKLNAEEKPDLVPADNTNEGGS